MNERIASAQRAHNEAYKRMNEVADKIESPDTPAEDLAALTSQFDEAEAEVLRHAGEVEKLTRIAEARSAHAPIDLPEPDKEERSLSIKDVRVGATAPTYHRHNPNVSWIADYYHIKEMDETSGESFERMRTNNREIADAVEKRAIGIGGSNPATGLSTGAGAGGEFAPPLWLQDEWIKLPRPGRPFADAVRQLTIPTGVNSINIPRVTGGTSTSAQTDNNEVQEVDITTNSLTVPLITVAGQQVLSRQSLERSTPGLDQVIFDDLLRDYDQKVDTYCLRGSGTSGQPTGVFNTSGVVSVSYTGSTGPALWTSIGGAVSQVSGQRFLPPDAIIMHPRRWFSLATSLDTQNRPLVLPAAGSYNTIAQIDGGPRLQGVAGTMFGLPVILDPNIQITNNTTQDVIYVTRLEDNYLWEESGGPRTFSFEQRYADTASVLLQVYGYMAFTAARYAYASAVITGSGLAAPAGF